MVWNNKKKGLEWKKFVTAVFLDLSQAFETNNHNILFINLNSIISLLKK